MSGQQTGGNNGEAGTNGNSGENVNDGSGGTGAGGNGNPDGNANGDGTGSNDGGNSGDGDGSSGSGSDGSGNHGFDGEFDPARARNLIDTLRNENKTLATANKQLATDLQEIKDLLKAAGKDPNANGNSGSSSDSGNSGGNSSDAALEAIRELRAEMAEEKLQGNFTQIATAMGMNPAAIPMAFAHVRESLNVVNGTAVNMTEVLGTLKAGQPFMFAAPTNGQAQGGSAGGGTNTAGNGKVYGSDEKASMQAFGMTPEEWEKMKASMPS